MHFRFPRTVLLAPCSVPLVLRRTAHSFIRRRAQLRLSGFDKSLVLEPSDEAYARNLELLLKAKSALPLQEGTWLEDRLHVLEEEAEAAKREKEEEQRTREVEQRTREEERREATARFGRLEEEVAQTKRLVLGSSRPIARKLLVFNLEQTYLFREGVHKKFKTAWPGSTIADIPLPAHRLQGLQEAPGPQLPSLPSPIAAPLLPSSQETESVPLWAE